MGYFVLKIFNLQFSWSPVLSLSSSNIMSSGVNNSLPHCAPSETGMAQEVLRGLDRSKGKSRNRSIFMFSILNILNKHNPFPQCHIKLLFSVFHSASSCSLELQPSKSKALRNVFILFFSYFDSNRERRQVLIEA